MHELDMNTWILEPNNIHTNTNTTNTNTTNTLLNNYMNIKERKILLDASSGVSITIDIDIHNPTKVCVLRWLCNIYYIHTYKHTHLNTCIYRSYQWTVFDLEARYT